MMDEKIGVIFHDWMNDNDRTSQWGLNLHKSSLLNLIKFQLGTVARFSLPAGLEKSSILWFCFYTCYQ